MNRRMVLFLAGFATLIGLLLTGAANRPVEAGGALFYTQTGAPFAWDNTQVINFTPDQGSLGRLSNAQAVQMTKDLFNRWAEVPTARLSFAQSGQLPMDVTGSNVLQVLNGLPRTTNAIVFDHDGTVTDALLGAAANLTVIGFAGPIRTLRGSGRITQSRAVLNGKFIDGLPRPTDEATPAYRATITHEFGHFLGLDHSSVNLEEAYDFQPSNNGMIPIMFSFSVGGETEPLKFDDIVAISTIYPNEMHTSARGAIHGQVLFPNGVSGYQGVEVIARRVGDPRITAAGGVSGFRFMGSRRGFGFGVSDLSQIGTYEIGGLPPGDYTVEIKGIPFEFTRGSGEGPLDPPAPLPSPEEFYSGGAESNSDSPILKSMVTVTAGGVVENINIIINGDPPANDDCGQAIPITSNSFSTTQLTGFASISADDLVHSCGEDRDSNSVWYRFTAPMDGILTVDTATSDYDTVLTIYTGDCANRVEAACNDDVSDFDSTSAISLPAPAGRTYLIQFSDFDDGPTGGTLRFKSTFAAAPVVPEQEPNNSVAQAQPVPIPGIIQGQVNRDDAGAINVMVGTLPDDVEDLYRVTLASGSSLNIAYDVALFPSTGIYLLRIEGGTVTTIASNIGRGTINVTGLTPGTYYIGVTNFDFDPNSPATDYTVTVTSK